MFHGHHKILATLIAGRGVIVGTRDRGRQDKAIPASIPIPPILGAGKALIVQAVPSRY